MKAVPTEAGDIKTASLVSKYMKWTLANMEEFNRECTILIKCINVWCRRFGSLLERKVDRYYRQISLEEIAQESPDLAEAIMAGDESAKDMIAQAFPNMKRRKTNKMVKELQATGVTDKFLLNAWSKIAHAFVHTKLAGDHF